MVNVWALFSVNFYADKMAIHELRNLTVFKAFALHYMAPMASGVADTEQQQFLLLMRLLKKGIIIFYPMNGIKAVLPEIGRGGPIKGVWLVLFRAIHWSRRPLKPYRLACF